METPMEPAYRDGMDCILIQVPVALHGAYPSCIAPALVVPKRLCERIVEEPNRNPSGEKKGEPSRKGVGLRLAFLTENQIAVSARA